MHLKRLYCIGMLVLLGCAGQGLAQEPATQPAVMGDSIEYKEGETILEGFLAAPPGAQAGTGKTFPAVLVLHDWMGVQNFAKSKAQELARMGYLALAADIYGKGIRPADSAEAAAESGKYKNDRALVRKRALAGLEVLRNHPACDKTRVAAIGYCFGGMVALELARANAPVAGVISFHGTLSAGIPDETARIEPRILVLHGADDPYVPLEEVTALQKELTSRGADWQLHTYANAVHSFTNPMAGADPSKGSAYNQTADRRATVAMKAFFAEIFRMPELLQPAP